LNKKFKSNLESSKKIRELLVRERSEKKLVSEKISSVADPTLEQLEVVFKKFCKMVNGHQNFLYNLLKTEKKNSKFLRNKKDIFLEEAVLLHPKYMNTKRIDDSKEEPLPDLKMLYESRKTIFKDPFLDLTLESYQEISDASRRWKRTVLCSFKRKGIPYYIVEKIQSFSGEIADLQSNGPFSNTNKRRLESNFGLGFVGTFDTKGPFVSKVYGSFDSPPTTFYLQNAVIRQLARNTSGQLCLYDFKGSRYRLGETVNMDWRVFSPVSDLPGTGGAHDRRRTIACVSMSSKRSWRRTLPFPWWTGSDSFFLAESARYLKKHFETLCGPIEIYSRTLSKFSDPIRLSREEFLRRYQ